MRWGHREEYEVYLTSKSDLHQYPLNSTKDFINGINGNLTHGSGIGVFVKIEKVVVSGVNERQFLVCLEGVPGCNTGDKEDPVVAICHNPERVSTGVDGRETRIYTFGEKGGYYPFSIG